MARLHGSGAPAKTSSAGVMSPRSCVTAAPAPMAGARRRLPVWARSLAAVTDTRLQTLAQDWSAQQSLLASMHLHPHEEDQEAELSNVDNSLSAFADDMQGQEGPLDNQTSAQPSGEEDVPRENTPLSPVPCQGSGLLSQALKAAENVKDKPDTLGSLARGKPTAPSSMSSHGPSASVADLVRIWQHQPMTVHSLPQQRPGSRVGSSGCDQGRSRGHTRQRCNGCPVYTKNCPEHDCCRTGEANTVVGKRGTSIF
ncbi:hypothetical protein WJX75_002577 [Coccomyxa subellipsoidea]|uniref:Uncharacterized protein n=1 Tax=Coccomyxa subellipsoidea TaxID=248742 RepID=A0ABR2YFV7_9CHLO